MTTAHDTTKLDDFTRHYITTALWSSIGDDDTPLDADYSADDLSTEALDKIKADCAKFQEDNAQVLSDLEDDGHEFDTFGHDFWLTRNGHGAGFWDGDYAEPMAQALTDASKAFGTCDLYVGDDGKLYLFDG